MERNQEVWRQLDTVVDPELDEPVTDMGFISRAEVDASNCVHVDFRLPTYWCAANFAFMMADDMRTALRKLPWVRDTHIVLGEHMYADTINHGVAKGLSFEETFADEADGNLDDLRRTFLLKAFQRRQEALINHLLLAGLSAGRIAAMAINQLQGSALNSEGQKLVERYLARRSVIGTFEPGSLAFVSVDGTGLIEADLSTYLAGLRRVRANAEFNGALCRGLLEVRFDLTTPLPPKTSSPRQSGDVCRTHTAALQK